MTLSAEIRPKALSFLAIFKSCCMAVYLSGEQKGYRPLAQATDEMERRLLDLNVENKPLLLAVTHDINVASFLAGRGVVSSFSDETWPHYLDAAVIMDDGYGTREYGWLRNVLASVK